MQPNIGSDFDNFLVEEGIREEVEAVATKRVLAYQLMDLVKPEKIEFTSQDIHRYKKKSLKGRE